MVVYRAEQAIPRFLVHFSKGGDAAVYATPPDVLGGGVKCRRILAADLRGANDTKELHDFNFVLGEFVRLLVGVSPPKVNQVDVYESPVVEAAFSAKRADFERGGQKADQIWVFHGTGKPGGVEAICSGGFKVGGQDVDVAHGTAYGQGVYTATGPSTPMTYGQLILCKALPGKAGLQGVGDSWKPRVDDDWVIFREAAQLWPKFVVHF